MSETEHEDGDPTPPAEREEETPADQGVWANHVAGHGEPADPERPDEAAIGAADTNVHQSDLPNEERGLDV